jgi:flagellar biosynthesis protein FlhF
MNVKRYTARTARDALALVRQSLGEDAVVLSTKPTPSGGVEVLAMAPESLGQVEQLSSAAPAQQAEPPRTDRPASFEARAAASAAAGGASAAPAQRIEPSLDASSGVQDATRLEMSTLSFQDYVRERLLKKRRAALGPQVPVTEAGKATAAPAASASLPATPNAARPGAADAAPSAASTAPRSRAHDEVRRSPSDVELGHDDGQPFGTALEPARGWPLPGAMGEAPRAAAPVSPLLQDALLRTSASHEALDSAASPAADEMMRELREMKGLIEERFGALAFMEKLQRHPAQARLSQSLLDGGFSPALIRKLADGLPAGTPDEAAWAAGVLERNLVTGEREPALEDQGGVYALIGATGVGKTTSTAKIAAAFATKYGSGALGLVTLDAYRIGAHEQLRTYGRILGVPVHTAHDRASLEDLLELLAGKKMVLIDTAGMAQRDARTRELLDMLSHHAIKKLLVVNAASQGETIEDVLIAYRARSTTGIVLSKVDEAVKLAPALDAMIRHKLKIVGVANGQRVPEDWHRLSAQALVQRALKGGGSSAYRLDASDVSLVFATPASSGRALHA